LGRGFLTGTFDRTSISNKDFRAFNPRFTGDNGDRNQQITDTVAAVAARKGLTASQVALAWVYAQQERLGVPVVPIPGTRRVKWLEQNVAALDVVLDDSDLAELNPLNEQVAGARY
jgi:aryl-alcohol dehydrogenase-like predicted oxidoreductase